MLGWAFKKGFQEVTGLRDAPQRADDTAQFDGPDTPAPVFAARAIKNAIWGQPAAANDPLPVKMDQNDDRYFEAAPTAPISPKAIPIDTRSPIKPNSILLTPGTGTSRRKRVSFGRDVKAGNNMDTSPFNANSNRNNRSRKKTTLQQALENARAAKPKTSEPPVAESEERPEDKPQEDDSEEEWEWEEDEDICCNHDVTVDLNEPHSESGKYWKAEWSRYREEAKADIEQLVKYKANARSFAAMKDMEANRLSQKLKEEQTRVAEMEKTVANMTAKLDAVRKHGSEKDNTSMVKDLESQTALVTEYRERVRDLETRLKEASADSNLNTSPRTEQSILEVGRELRKARSELREQDRLRNEIKRLKSNLATSRERVAELEAQATAGEVSESSRTGRLEKQLRQVKEESRQKDSEIRKLKRDYETLKRDAKSRTAEAIQVLQEKNNRIDELEKKLKEAEAMHASSQQRDLDAVIAEHNRFSQDLRAGLESRGTTLRREKPRPTDRRMRAMSIEDLTLDMTQRSLLNDINDQLVADRQPKKPFKDPFIVECSADNTIEPQVEDEKIQYNNVGRIRELQNADASPYQPRSRVLRQRSLQDQRVMSDVLSNRVNESSRRQSRRYQQSDSHEAFAPDDDQNNAAGRRSANLRTTSLGEDRLTTHGTPGRPNRQSRISARNTRPDLPNNNEPVIDLVQTRFSRLGGPSIDQSAAGDASRSTTRADRQAAARLRVAQKRIERQKANSQGLDKENIRP